LRRGVPAKPMRETRGSDFFLLVPMESFTWPIQTAFLSTLRTVPGSRQRQLKLSANLPRARRAARRVPPRSEYVYRRLANQPGFPLKTCGNDGLFKQE
jgi:hypothetical protein